MENHTYMHITGRKRVREKKHSVFLFQENYYIWNTHIYGVSFFPIYTRIYARSESKGSCFTYIYIREATTCVVKGALKKAMGCESWPWNTRTIDVAQERTIFPPQANKGPLPPSSATKRKKNTTTAARRGTSVRSSAPFDTYPMHPPRVQPPHPAAAAAAWHNRHIPHTLDRERERAGLFVHTYTYTHTQPWNRVAHQPRGSAAAPRFQPRWQMCHQRRGEWERERGYWSPYP